MATSYASLADKIRANQAAQAAINDKVAALEIDFEKEHGKKPRPYVQERVIAAIGKSGEAGGYHGRSQAGIDSAEEPSLADPGKGDIKAYHDMEEKAKEAARAGDHKKAAAYYGTAADMRIAYEKKTGRYNEATKLPYDAGHANRVVSLRERRDSLVGLPAKLAGTDPDVVAAKLVVKNFFQKNGIIYHI